MEKDVKEVVKNAPVPAGIPLPPYHCVKCRVLMNKISEHHDPNFGDVKKYQCPICKKEKIEY